MKLTFLCICCDFKGGDFLSALHHLGHEAYLVTSEKTKVEPWPFEHIKEVFYIPGKDGRIWNMEDLIKGTAYLLRTQRIDKIIALDDYDVWKAASLREEFRSPGMGQTTARHFFDKLAMRMIAADHDLPIPEFSPLFNDTQITEFLNRTPGPWIVKPRSDAGALGIRKINSADEFWNWNEGNLEQRHRYLIEEFKPGPVYHVDSLFIDYQSLFTRSSQYLSTPFEIAHGGGVFRSQTLDPDEPDSHELRALNDRVIKAFGLKFGASHSEYIKHPDGRFYFLETSARVGGAHLADMVEAATSINLWAEWAKIECSRFSSDEYTLPPVQNHNAGIIATLSHTQHPDYSGYQDEAIWWTLKKEYHAGMIVRDASKQEVNRLMEHYTQRLLEDFHTSIPLQE